MKLSDFELDVMQLFWDHGPNSAPDIHNAIQGVRPVSYSAVKTIIDRLEDKGALMRSDQRGITIIYSPKVERIELSKPLLSTFVRRLFGGKPRELISQLIDDERLDRADIEYLEQKLAERRKERPEAEIEL